MYGKDALRKRIAALREMTTGRGCTEAEALAAAAKAAQLMHEHGLSDSDIEIDQRAKRTSSVGRSPRARLWPVIAGCTNTAEIITGTTREPEITFIGHAPGPEIAVYLWTVCDRALTHEIAKFKASKLYRKRRTLKTKRAAVEQFTTGIVLRLCYRLEALFEPLMSAEEAERAGVALRERYSNIVEVAPKKAALGFGAEQMAGWVAGSNTALSHGVGGADSAPLMIGGAA